MKFYVPILGAFMLLLNSCTINEKKIPLTANSITTDSLAKQRFFPVTTYIKGQLYSIKEKGLNPIQYIIEGNKKDSSWLKIEDLPSAINEFITPEIDSTNLIQLFLEKKFVDQSLDAVTLTYEPIKKLPDSLSLSSWTVYIEPETGNVKRIYLVKTKTTKTTQLTWNSNANCKMVYLTSNADGSFVVDKEVKINWDY
jgi:hypothetical protein